MFGLRLKRATRRISHSPNRPRLRLHQRPINSHYYSVDRFRTPANDARYNRYKRGIRFRYAALFHDARTRLDPLLSLFTPQQISDRYAPIIDTVSEGQADHRYFDWSSNDFLQADIAPVAPARVPARILGTKYIVAPSSPVVESSGPTGAFYSFAVPKQVLVCVRRKQRKEVMHALGHAGSRKRQAKPRRNETSYIRC